MSKPLFTSLVAAAAASEAHATLTRLSTEDAKGCHPIDVVTWKYAAAHLHRMMSGYSTGRDEFEALTELDQSRVLHAVESALRSEGELMLPHPFMDAPE